ncbi:MAG: T9SS type A sorting domain-containing protein [Flavobacteriales bacterium]|nr:T9SS type A sorting domain-containing protein [Flavobacteriales bacterium]
MRKRFLLKSLMAMLLLIGFKAESIAQDDICTPTALTVGVQASADNTGATADGPIGGCWFDATVENDIWFTFVAPASGDVNIETIFTGGNSDTQIGVYSSSDGTCTGTLTEVGCNDDNPVDFMAIADVCGLTPGSQYFLQVDGWQGAAGAFDILITEIFGCESCDPTGCDAGGIVDDTPIGLCPDEIGSITGTGITLPTDNSTCNAVEAILFTPLAGATGGVAGGFNLTFAGGITWPYTFDSDVNGVMSGNGLDSLRGNWELRPAVFVQFDNTNCAISSDSLIVTFFGQGEGGCDACDPAGCEAGNPADDSPQVLCPDDVLPVDFLGWSPPTDQTCAYDYRLRFRPVSLASGGFTDTLCNSVGWTLIIDPSLTANVSSDMLGFSSSFLLEPMRGNWVIDGIMVVDGFICDSTDRDIDVNFLDYEEEGCPSKCAPDQNDITVSINFDDYSEETSYTLRDDAGNIIDSTGSALTGFSCFTKSYCLPDGCYSFTIYDAFGDGICCQWGNGSYSVTDDAGATLASGGDFGNSETTAFCLGGQDCSVFDTAPVDLTKSFECVPYNDPEGVRDRVQVKWFKALGQVRYTDEDAAMCDIQFWPKKQLDEFGNVIGDPANTDTITLVDKVKTYGDGSPRSIFKWPIKFRADGVNNNNRVEPNVRYGWRVRCECGHDGNGPESPWSESKIFNTPNFNPVTGIDESDPCITNEIEDSSDETVKALAQTSKKAVIKTHPLVSSDHQDALLQKRKGQKGQLVLPLEKEPVAQKRAVLSSSMSLYPNPVDNELTIRLTDKVSGVAQIRIMDMTGRLIEDSYTSLRGEHASLRVNVSDLGTGLYSIEVLVNGKVYRDQFVVK